MKLVEPKTKRIPRALKNCCIFLTCSKVLLTYKNIFMYSSPFISTGFISRNSTNHGLKFYFLFPESSKEQNLNLPFTDKCVYLCMHKRPEKIIADKATDKGLISKIYIFYLKRQQISFHIETFYLGAGKR